MSFPFEGEIFDYFIDFEKMKFSNWNNLLDINYQQDTDYFHEIQIPTNHTVKYNYLLNLMVQNKFNTLFYGDWATGKSSVIKQYLKTLDYTKISLNFS